MARYKAVLWLGIKDYIEKHTTSEQYEKYISTLDQQVREELFSKELLPISWVDPNSMHAAVDSFCRSIGKHPDDLVLRMDIARFVHHKNFNTIYRVFLNLPHPGSCSGLRKPNHPATRLRKRLRKMMI